jgi:hypothetical protein
MSDTDNVQGNGEKVKVKAAHKAVFATLELAKAVTPPSDKFKVFAIEDADGEVKAFVWGFTGLEALATFAKSQGWSASAADSKRGTISPEKAAEKLLALSDADLKALGLTRAKVKK